MENLVAKRYVKALVEAMGDEEIEKVATLLKPVALAFEDRKFAEIMASPEISKDQREGLVLELLGEKVDPKLSNFVKTLGIHNRFGLIPDIVTLLEKEMQRRANRYEGIVESDKAIDKKLVEDLEKSLSRYVNATVVLHPIKRDREGIKVTIEDLGLEASFSKERVTSDMINHILKAL